MRRRAKDLLLDHFRIALHRIYRGAQFVEQLAQAIRAALGPVVDGCDCAAEAANIAVEAPVAAGEAGGGVDNPVAFDSVGAAERDGKFVNRLAVGERRSEIVRSRVPFAALRQIEPDDHGRNFRFGPVDPAFGIRPEAESVELSARLRIFQTGKREGGGIAVPRLRAARLAEGLDPLHQGADAVRSARRFGSSTGGRRRGDRLGPG